MMSLEKSGIIKTILKICVILVIFMILDGIYISLTYGLLFERVLRKINNTNTVKIRYWSAILFYFITAIGFYFFLEKERKPLYYSFLFGLFIYSFYEITNYTIIDSWTLPAVVVDSIWGGVLFLLVAVAMRIIF
jgi:uncharacterized membrane protein